MADRWTVFSEAVRHSLEGWPALHIAKQQRFGGNNIAEKLEWLLEVIIQVFRNNEHVYPDELEDYISECLYNEFDMIVEDGTTQKLVGKICKFSDYCNSGKIAEVIEELKVPPQSIPAVIKQVTDNSLSEDESKLSSCEEQQANTSSTSDSSFVKVTDMDVDEIQPMEMEKSPDDEGWEVVKKSRKKKSKT